MLVEPGGFTANLLNVIVLHKYLQTIHTSLPHLNCEIRVRTVVKGAICGVIYDRSSFLIAWSSHSESALLWIGNYNCYLSARSVYVGLLYRVLL